MKRTIGIICLVIAACLPIGASEFHYDGPELRTAYNGPVLIDNSHFILTNEDIRDFDTGEYLHSHAPNLMPLLPTIRTWASMQGIHPRVLIELLDGYWKGGTVAGTKEEIDVVYQVTAGLARMFWSEYDDSLAGTRAVAAVAEAYSLHLDLPDDLAVRRTLTPRLGTVNPFGYFQPPFPIGETWWGGGAHSNTGGSTNMNALDWAGRFGSWGEDYSNNWVSAMQGGTMNVLAECSIEILHDDGWRTSYYHLENPQFPIGGPYTVTRNTAIANIANDSVTALCQGGSSSGPHTHTAMWRNGTPQVVDEANLDFTAFSQHSSNTAYDWDCNTSWYNHFSTGTECPGQLNLLNDSPPPDGPIFTDGFEDGSTSAWIISP